MEVNTLTGGRTVDTRNPPNSKSVTLCKKHCRFPYTVLSWRCRSRTKQNQHTLCTMVEEMLMGYNTKCWCTKIRHNNIAWWWKVSHIISYFCFTPAIPLYGTGPFEVLKPFITVYVPLSQQNAVHLLYEHQPVNVTYGYNWYLCCKPKGTHIYCVHKMQGYLMLQQLVQIVNTGLSMVKY
jgi:hypothetical protein